MFSGLVVLRCGLLVLLLASPASFAQSSTSSARVSSGKTAPIPIDVLVKSPANTDTELQVICLFQSVPANTLHGSLLEIDEKLGGLLGRVRRPSLFAGDLGETLLIRPKSGSIHAHALLIIGLGDSQTFTPARMDLVGAIVYQEGNRLGARHPFFAPTVLDGGVSGFGTADVAVQFARGFLRAQRMEAELRGAGLSTAETVQKLTFLAGAAHASDTQAGIAKAYGQD